MSPKSGSMDHQPFFHLSISAAKDPAPDLLGSEEEDGDVYAELWQQILQLTSDEDDSPVGLANQGSRPVVAPSPVSGSDCWVNNRLVELSPVWQLSQPTSGSGTGVFIPSIDATKQGHQDVSLGKKASKNKKKKKKAKKQVENK